MCGTEDNLSNFGGTGSDAAALGLVAQRGHRPRVRLGHYLHLQCRAQLQERLALVKAAVKWRGPAPF